MHNASQDPVYEIVIAIVDIQGVGPSTIERLLAPPKRRGPNRLLDIRRCRSRLSGSCRLVPGGRGSPAMECWAWADDQAWI